MSEGLKKMGAIIVLTIALRLMIDGIQVYADTAIGSFFVVFGPPAVGVLTFVSVFLPVSKYTRRIVQVARIALGPLVINSAYRVFEYLHTRNACETVSGGYTETFCLTLAIQLWVHIPFIVITGIIMLWFGVRHRQYLPVPNLSLGN